MNLEWSKKNLNIKHFWLLTNCDWRKEGRKFLKKGNRMKKVTTRACASRAKKSKLTFKKSLLSCENIPASNDESLLTFGSFWFMVLSNFSILPLRAFRWSISFTGGGWSRNFNKCLAKTGPWLEIKNCGCKIHIFGQIQRICGCKGKVPTLFMFYKQPL